MKYIQLFETFKKNYKEKISPSNFKEIEIGKTVLYGGGRHTVIDNDGFILTIKGKDGKILTVNLNQFNDKGAINEARSIAKIEKDRAATVNNMADIVQSWKAARDTGDKQKEASFLQQLKKLTLKKKSLEQELNAKISDKDRYIELVITEQSIIYESVMSDINLLAKEAKNYKDFVKEFVKKYNDLADTGDSDHFEKWLKSIYDTRNNESLIEGEAAIKSIGDHWFDAYGENFIKEYPKIAKIVKMHPNVDRRTMETWWNEIYDENFKEKYPEMWNKLS